MSLLESLKPNEGSTHKKKRVGRCRASGHGKTSAKGHKGQLARTGGKVRRGFEGGQMPLVRRIPKFGFKNLNRVEYNILNLSDLNRFEGEVSPEILMANKVLKRGAKLKILANGTLEKSINVKAHKFSEKAKEAIEKAGGKVDLIQEK